VLAKDVRQRITRSALLSEEQLSAACFQELSDLGGRPLIDWPRILDIFVAHLPKYLVPLLLSPWLLRMGLARRHPIYKYYYPIFWRDFFVGGIFFFVSPCLNFGEQGPMVPTELKSERANKSSQENGRERRYDEKKKEDEINLFFDCKKKIALTPYDH